MTKVLIFIQFLAVLFLVYVNGYRNYKLERNLDDVSSSNKTLDSEKNRSIAINEENKKLVAKITELEDSNKTLLNLVQKGNEERKDILLKIDLLTKDLNHFMTISKLDSKSIELIQLELKNKVIQTNSSSLKDCQAKSKQLKQWYDNYKKELKK